MLLSDRDPLETLQLSPTLAQQGRVRVYRHATVVDGTGADRFIADVAVEGRRIVAIARQDESGTAHHELLEQLPVGVIEVDARGLVLAPGFIDMHAHSDLAVLQGTAHTAKLLQGVTTEVIGQDGLGYAPVDDAAAATISAQIAGWNGRAPDFSWRTMSEYLAKIDAATVGNTAVLVPQGNLRMMVIGHDNRAATPDEIQRMAALLGESLDAGAVGMSSGLTYTPGMYASTDELVALCRVVAERGGYWAPHTRSYGAAALDAYAEALEIGRRTGCPIHLTHATMNFEANWGRAHQLLALVDRALADGVDVTIDTYPYLPGATTLAALLPSHLARGGDVVAAVAALDDEARAQVRHELDIDGSDGFHGQPADWSLIEISGVGDPAHSDLVGRRVSEIAATQGRAPVDVVLDLVVADAGETGILMHIGHEPNVREIMRHPRHTGGSDGILVGDKPHPRGFGAFARYLGYYVREEAVLTLEEAVQHLSGTPAQRLGLHRGDAPRGVIREGAVADLVLFDAERIASAATFDAPRTEPVGIHEVVVDGTVVVRDGALTGNAPGSALRLAPVAHRATVPVLQTHIDPLADDLALHSEFTVEAPAELADTAQLVRDLLAAVSTAKKHPDAAVRSALVRLTIVDAPVAGSDSPEAFEVTVKSSGIDLRGASATGVLRAALALQQLLPGRGESGYGEVGSRPPRLPAGTWSGAPSHAWRGLMVDVARHFRPVADLHRVVDLLALHQLNVLHLHLTDDQGWRFPVPAYPRLTTIGAHRTQSQRGHGPQATVEPGVHEGFYTAEELRALDAYARSRGVLVVPEVELPGHVQAALAAYPELGNTFDTDPVTEPWPRFGINPRTLAPTEAALQFGYAAIDALCDIFESPWVGIGGDEVPTTEWAASVHAQQRMAELGIDDVRGVQPWFTAAYSARVRAHGRTPLGWDEVLEGDVPEGMEVLAWRGPVASREALRRGIPVIACPDLDLYFDYRQSPSADEPVPVGPPLNLERAYQLVLPEGVRGGQANAWSEHLPTRDRLDFALFPRLAASAERLWLGGEPLPYEQFARRMATHLRRLEERGVKYRPLDGPTPAQRRPGVPGNPITVEQRMAIVADLVAGLEGGGAPASSPGLNEIS